MAEINCPDDTGKTPLHNAVENNDINTVKILKRKNVDINIRDSSGRTPLHLAVNKGHLEIAKYLIRYNPIVGPQPRSGKSVLYSAVERGYIDVVRYLLEQGADVNASYKYTYCGEHKTYPLHIACEKNRHEIVEMLLVFGAKINLKDDANRTALHIATEMDHPNCTQHLLRD